MRPIEINTRWTNYFEDLLNIEVPDIIKEREQEDPHVQMYKDSITLEKMEEGL